MPPRSTSVEIVLGERVAASPSGRPGDRPSAAAENIVNWNVLHTSPAILCTKTCQEAKRIEPPVAIPTAIPPPSNWHNDCSCTFCTQEWRWRDGEISRDTAAGLLLVGDGGVRTTSRGEEASTTMRTFSQRSLVAAAIVALCAGLPARAASTLAIPAAPPTPACDSKPESGYGCFVPAPPEPGTDIPQQSLTFSMRAAADNAFYM